MLNERAKIGTVIKRKLKQFYGRDKPCVVINKKGAGYHHLDENPNNSKFENLVPLVSKLNQDIENTQRDPRAALPHDLEPQNLLALAQSHYVDGLYPISYGAARLAAFLAGPRKRGKSTDPFIDSAPSMAIEACSRSIEALRMYSDKLMAHPLMEDVIKRNVFPQLEEYDLRRQVTWKCRALLATQIEAVCRDCGNFKSALLWGKLSLELLKRANLPNNDVVFMEVHQHYGLSHPEKSIFLKELQIAFEPADSKAQKFTNRYWRQRKIADLSIDTPPPSFRSVLDEIGARDIALKALSEYPDAAPSNVTMGTWGHLLLGHADWLRFKGSTDQMRNMVIQARRFFQRYNIAPSVFVKHKALREYENDYNEKDCLLIQKPSDINYLQPVFKKLMAILVEP